MSSMEKKSTLIDAAYPDYTATRKLTYAGALRQYYIELDHTGKNIGLSRRWNKATTGTYSGHYMNRILPLLDRNKALEDYSEEDFLLVLEQIKEQYHLADRSTEHYRYLLWIVYRAGFQHDLFEDRIYWDDIFDLYDENEKQREANRIQVLMLIKKSFSIEEERALLNYFLSLDPETARGEDVGQLIMFGFGYRNNEAAGLDCSSMKLVALEDGADMYTISNVQSTKQNSNELKAGGKTPNSPRELPGLDFVFDFLIRRRDFLYRLVDKGEILLPEEYEGDKRRLPLVCRGNDYLVRCSSADLSKAGRRLFDSIGISKKQLSFLAGVLYSGEMTDLTLEEKDPTTYLYRRALATHLHSMGFTDSEKQYYMGHDVEAADQLRHDFVNTDKLRAMKEKLDMHPLYAFLSTPHKCVALNSAHPEIDRHSAEEDVEIVLDSSHKQAVLVVESREPQEKLQVKFNKVSGEKIKITLVSSPKKAKNTDEPDIKHQVWHAYEKGI